ncbi:MAG: trehalose utilization protein ThuA [Provencibacterium sp.]|jgi:trehalose utilization protein|nr:trehalose utilization protein ThuA [Provencibacterium sp.]
MNSEKLRVLVWTEGIYAERQPLAAKTYPQGIGTVLTEFLSRDAQLIVREGGLKTMEQDFSEEALAKTDVLVWWGHLYHDEVTDEMAERICRRILEGMGFIALHSSMGSKVFRRLMGTSCHTKWREIAENERLWVIDTGHPIAVGLEKEYLDVPHTEIYSEPFDIPAPDELVFISWYAGGEVLRSGCCYRRGAGKIFYFSTGHEEYPIYHQPEIQKVITNAVHWAKPSFGPKPQYTCHSPPLEDIHPQ